MKSQMEGLLCCLITCIFVSLSGTGWSANYYVNDNSTNGDVYTSIIGSTINSGLSAGNPKASLSEIWNTYGPTGTNVISSGDTIFVDAGTYLALDANLTLNVNGITLVGAGSTLTFFDNDQTSVDANRWATITGDNITISGMYLTGYNYGFGDANVIQISGVSNLTLIDVIVNENLPGGGSSSIVVNGGSEVDFIGGGSSCNPGASSVAGGGVNVEGNGNDVDFINYVFSANTKDYEGGSGLHVTGDATTTIDIDDCIFSSNTNSSAEGGGAIFIAEGATMTIDGTCFNDNTSNQISSTNYGGAITVGRGSTVTINNCSFDGNSSTSSGNGGALAINTNFGTNGSAGTINISTCNFTNNAAADGADILGRVGFSRPAIFNITECTFSGTGDDIRNDNSATITVANSGAPSFSGTVSFTNTTPASTTANTNCPTIVQPCFSVLPVTFKDFWSECQNEDLLLYWTTLSEINNDYFLLERADEDLIFEEIAQIDGSGTTTATQNYAYTDRHSAASAYYRLSQVDIDGSRTYLKTIFTTNCNESGSIVSHFFNPSDASIDIFYKVDQILDIELTIISAAGSVLLRDDIRLSPDHYVETVPLTAQLNSGIYFIQIQSESETYLGKFLLAW